MWHGIKQRGTSWTAKKEVPKPQKLSAGIVGLLSRYESPHFNFMSLLHYIPHVSIGTIIVFVGRYFLGVIKGEWKVVTARLERIESVQGVQAENHLKTIESNTTKTNEILEAMRTDQLELNGSLKTLVGILQNQAK